MSCSCMVLAVKHPSGYHAACNNCWKKLRKVGSKRVSYSCRSCNLSYLEADVPLRYHVILNVTDYESTCIDVAVFGESLNNIFGLTAGQFHSCLKEAYKIQTGRELELHDVPRFLRSILESVFVGNSFVFRFSSCEGGVRLSDLLNQQSGQGEVQPLTTCGLNALGSHPSRTVLSALKSTFPVLQKLLLLPPSPILPPLHHIKCEEESASFTLCGSPNDEGLSVQSGVELESISGASGLVPSNSPGNPFSDYSLLHMPSVNLGSLFTPPFDTSLDPCGHPCVDDCSTPKPTSASFLVLSQRAWRDFEHSSVRSSDLASKPLLHVGRNIPGSSPCASSTFIKDGDLASSKTSPELFSEPRPHVQQSAGHYKTPCASSKNLRRRILSQLDNSISQNKVDLRGASSRSPDLFTP